jgi:cell division initiation protein
MPDFDTAEFRAARFSRDSADEIRNREFPVVMRGYDRNAVDAFVEDVAELVSQLEGRQSHESVVQRALEEVGEETAGILQRAHEAADEIAARSRSQAEGRMQRAEREAELLRRDADAYSEKIVVDTKLLWEERQRLIEDLRQLAEDVLSTSENASARVSKPQMLSEDEAPPAELEAAPTEVDAAPSEVDGPPTSEVELDVLQGGAQEDEATRGD